MTMNPAIKEKLYSNAGKLLTLKDGTSFRYSMADGNICIEQPGWVITPADIDAALQYQAESSYSGIAEKYSYILAIINA